MKYRNGFQLMLQLIGLVKPLTGFMILAITLGLLGHLAATFITIFGAYAIGNILGFFTNLSLTVLFVSVVVFAVFRGILRYGEQACNHYIAFKLLALLREKVFFVLRKLCPAKLEGKDKGDLISIITSDIELLEVFYAHTISPIAIATLFSLLLSGFIASFHPLLGGIALLAYFVIGVCVPIFISKRSGKDGLHFRSQSGELSSFVLDSLRGLPEILQYHQGQNRLQQMDQRTEQLSHQEKRMKRVLGENQAITNSLLLFFDVLMLFCATGLYLNQQISFTGVLLSTVALMSSFGPCVALANLGSTLQNTFAAGNRILNILEESPVTEEITGEKEIQFEGASVKQVSFSYQDQCILNNVSLEIPKGSIVGIIGKSGSGKSTLLKLLMRFWQVQTGEIAISQQNINQINTTNLRNLESLVTQETHLFQDTIRNNIKIAKLNATDQEIEQACKKSSIHDFILGLPQGYDTQVGELGDTLSGGECQRLGLARAFLHDADLMLLDEPTSNLDSLNEGIILQSIQKERKNKTVVLISHRQSTMAVVDKQYSVEYGRLS